MDEVHQFVGFSVPASFLLLFLWAVYSLVRNRPPHDWFWGLLAFSQVVVAIQIVIGGVLFLMGRRPLGAGGPIWLHYVYGGLFPAFILYLAHRFARRYEGVPYLVFGGASLICFGLTFRALQTGLT